MFGGLCFLLLQLKKQRIITAIEKASISLIGRNLFFLSNSTENIDPESAYNSGNSAGLEWFGLPVPRTIGLNINLKF